MFWNVKTPQLGNAKVVLVVDFANFSLILIPFFSKYISTSTNVGRVHLDNFQSNGKTLAQTRCVPPTEHFHAILYVEHVLFRVHILEAGHLNVHHVKREHIRIKPQLLTVPYVLLEPLPIFVEQPFHLPVHHVQLAHMQMSVDLLLALCVQLAHIQLLLEPPHRLAAYCVHLEPLHILLEQLLQLHAHRAHLEHLEILMECLRADRVPGVLLQLLLDNLYAHCVQLGHIPNIHSSLYAHNVLLGKLLYRLDSHYVH